MTLFQAIVLGIVQGITELLPISSTGHLIIVPKLFGWAPHSLAFDTTLHIGTALALLIYFWNDLFSIFKSFLQDIFSLKTKLNEYSKGSVLALEILIGSIPAGIIGVLLGDALEAYFRDVRWVAVFLLAGSLLIYGAQKYSKSLIHSTDNISYKKSFIIGMFQTIALLPGFSRSGSTISGALLADLDRETAAKFSFLLSVPIVLAAGIYSAISSRHVLFSTPLLILLAGMFTSFLSGLFSIKFLMGFLKKHNLDIFVYYRIILALILLILFF